MMPLNARKADTMDGGGSSFSLANRLLRLLWNITWLVLASWTPAPFHGWRRFLLRCFGARIGAGVRVYGSARIWLPANLEMERLSWLGPGVRCYNQGAISIGERTVISQNAHLCASSHDVNDYYFQLILKPICIKANAWIAADAFVGPGVTVGEGAVLGARGVAIRDLEAWTIYRGNPAEVVRRRMVRQADDVTSA